MERLHGPLADLVAAERDEMEAMPNSKDAAWAGVAAAWQPPPPPPIPPGATEAVASASKAGVLKVLGGLVVGTSVAAGMWTVSSDDTRPPVDRVEAPVVVAVPADAEPPPPPASLPLVAPPPPAPKPTPEEPATAGRPNPVPNKALGLAEELALIDAMRKDVAAGRYAKALARAKEHRESFAKGSLIADRMDLEAAARCGGGDLDAGRALADRKEKRWPRAPMSQRLRNLCRME
jgi:hypothetical protein